MTEATMKKHSEACPDCETGELHLERYNEEFEYHGQTLTVEGLECLTCDHCGAEIIRPEEIRHGDKLFADARRRADGLLTGTEIVRIRKNLGLTQRQAAELFGGGANAFSKYERGDVTQSAAMDRLMRMVARFPSLLGSLAQDAGVDLDGAASGTAYAHMASVSMNDPEFRSRKSTNNVVVLEEIQWRKAE